jgi:hypothetical protein
MPASAQKPHRLERFPGPIAIAIAFAGLVAWTWLTWPDVFVDFGREFYVPMRLAEGAVLYRDLAYFNGPLSPYFNALCLGIFGASLRTLFLVNIVLLALLTGLLYRMLARIGDALSASVAVMLFLCVFALAQLTGFGNYNFVAPYSHELTHGVILGIAALAALGRWGESGHVRWLAATGACIGLAMLGKPETAAAALGAGALAFALRLRDVPATGRRPGIFAASILAPPVLAIALLALRLPVAEALAAVAKPWTGLGSGETTALAFYREGMGIDAPAHNLLAMLTWAGYWLLAFLPAALAALKSPLAGQRRAWAACAAFAIYAFALLLMRDRIDWSSAARPLPLFVAILLVLAVRRRSAAVAGMALFALVLLGKMLLNARVNHYGFALAFPAMVLVVAALCSWVPAAIERRGGNGGIFRGAVLAAVAVFALGNMQTTAGFRAEKTVGVGKAGDAFKADIRGRYMNAALAQLATSPAASTVAVMPEGVMMNVLSQRHTSLRYINFMPPEVLLFGEDRMLADLAAHPPDRIVLVHKDTSEYGVPYFGRDYGGRLMAWIHANYSAEALIGDPPLQPGADFGVLVLVRNSPSAE